mmetsp:Transcript_22997/g.25544  ORF Transcript_22997/g.25544 Transcript_22997/m.25544 type:complete len:320 (-) Transcript_22997:45-1004(-)|eukprot:CAMPEP_0205821172 /NCGR_PEP_ID=MMETSP0206-20130828/5648_1 /ASSEMBLY_ACC=CAM_ASM_000279 /TAXON_ID=36767 /ORGANISM="Euplotes focardii, Strain TN1" /LENGTH=319 /DNA_ID=CAMNT_0053116443 /DNA_START=24 /DNA_END=986 /DNA_ORIENTATION=+
MDQILGTAMEVVGEMNEIEESNYGALSGVDIKVKLNDCDESGIGIKGQILFSGPTLGQVKSNGTLVFPDLAEDDMFTILTLRTKGDPQAAIDELQGIIEAFGLPLEALSQFGELKFQAGDGEIHIGFKASENPYSQMILGMLIKPKFFGDGSQDITGDFAFNMGTTFSEMLNDDPIFTHIIKAMTFEIKGSIHDKTRENLLNILNSKKEALGPFLGAIHALFFVKNIKSNLEIETTDELKEKLIESAAEINPMAVMSLNEIFGLAKSAGLPLEMLQPILEFISTKTAGEITLSGVASIGFKITIRVPGLDGAVGTFLAD